MYTQIVFLVIFSAFRISVCQQPLDDLSEISSYVPPDTVQKKLLHQCESFAQNLSEENERLKNEVEILKRKVEALEDIEEDEDEEDEEEDGKDESNESEEPTKGLRSRRGARCDGGTLSAWACAPQCIFKLKGLCGLSLKTICHC